MRRSMIGHWRTTWSTVCSFAPHSLAAEKGIPYLYKQERKRPTLVRRRLSRTQALLGRVTAGGSVPMSGIKMRSRVGLSARSAFRWLSGPVRRTYMVVVRWTDELLCGGYNWVSRFEAPCICTQWTVSAGWSRCPGSMARRIRDSVAPLRRSSAGWMPTRIGRLSAGVGRRDPITMRKAS